MVEWQIGAGRNGWMYQMSDIFTRVCELQDEIRIIEHRLAENPLDASANARYKWLETLVKELTKFNG